MSRTILGVFLGLILAGIGGFWWQGRAEIERAAPPPEPAAALAVSEAFADPDLPSADVSQFHGPAPPEASELSREQRRFFRYDRNHDWRISRNEMLSSRTDAFRKLDKDGNNLLDFEEWAVTTVEKFEGADADGNRELTPSEFATTAPKRSKSSKSRCSC